MKQIISIILLLCVTEIVSAQRKDKNTFSTINPKGQTLYYQILSETEKTVALVKGKYKEEQYIIPETVSYQGNKYTVTEIGEKAFAYCKSLKKVSLPNSLLKIRESAFAKVRSLSSVTFNEGLEEICSFAFYDTSINIAIIPKSVKQIGKWAFLENPIRELYISDNLNKLGKGAFRPSAAFPGIHYSGLIKNLPPWITAENCEEYGIGKEAFNSFHRSKLAQQHTTPQIVYVQSPTPSNIFTPATVVSNHPVPSSDVDKDIPTNPINNENTFAIIIANENYQEESLVDYAINDGEMFKTYCNKVLGLPEENIHFRKDATLNNILSDVRWLADVAKAYKGDAKLIVYYAGHGIPDETSGSAYLLPVDGKGNILSTGYSLANLYKTLGELPAKNVTVFMDACFSGAQRNGKMLASARGVAIKAKAETPKGKMVVFSAAQGDETAYPYNDKEHGLFTYFLLKKLQETKGNVTYNELAEYIQQQVSRKSIVANGKSQTPTVVSSASMGGDWKTMKLK